MNNDLKWLKMYVYAIKYYNEYGNLEVPKKFRTNDGINYDKDGIIKLGSWISTQRYFYSYNRLTNERQRLLEKIDMVWNIHSLKWKETYEYAKKYYEEYGNLEVPYNFKTNDGINYNEEGIINLDQWISSQRKRYNNDNLSQERKQLLNEIGMIWDVPLFKWNEMYEYAKKYYQENGNLEVSYLFRTFDGINYDEEGLSLGIWVYDQRLSYRNNQLSSERIKLLELIGMRFNNKRIITNKSWEDMYEYAKKYYNEYGNLEIPQKFRTFDGINYDEEGFKLGNWINNQRKYYKNNQLSNERKELLEDINMVWEILMPRWKNMYEYAKKYYEEYGNLEISKNFKTKDGINYDESGVKLGTWISAQRYYYNTNNLSQEKIELLESIEMVWSMRKHKKKERVL